jgi:hypothetical protein
MSSNLHEGPPVAETVVVVVAVVTAAVVSSVVSSVAVIAGVISSVVVVVVAAIVAAIVTTIVHRIAIGGDGEINGVIERTVLGNRDNNWLMVRRRVDGRHLVDSRSETIGDNSRKTTVLSSLVQTLEEDELLGIGRSDLIQRLELLDNDMGVTLNLTLIVQLLRSGEIVGLGVNEESGLHLLNGHLDGERLTGFDGSEVAGIDELG